MSDKLKLKVLNSLTKEPIPQLIALYNDVCVKYNCDEIILYVADFMEFVEKFKPMDVLNKIGPNFDINAEHYYYSTHSALYKSIDKDNYLNVIHLVELADDLIELDHEYLYQNNLLGENYV